MTDLDNAKRLLFTEKHTCVLCKGDVVYASGKAGIAPIVAFFDTATPLEGFSAADRIVGKAAAMLYHLAGVVAIYADVASKGAVEYCLHNNIECSAALVVDNIINRAGTGSCPMEDAVRGIDDPAQALAAVRAKMASLRKH